MDFFQAQLQDTKDRNYDMKQRKLKSALNFIDEYNNSNKNLDSLELKEKANEYFLASHGIINHNKPDLSKFSSERVENIYIEICQNSKQIFTKFYDSYSRKVEMNYYQNFVDNAFQDLLVAYKLYCISNKILPESDPTLEQLETINKQISKSISPDKADITK